jgi:protein involved in temperature-dependent protein secretion
MRQHRYRVMRREALLTRLQNFTPGTLTGEKDEDTLAVLQRKSLRSKSHRANTPQREADYREDESSSQ